MKSFHTELNFRGGKPMALRVSMSACSATRDTILFILLVYKFYLQSEHGDTESKQESLSQRVNWFQNINLLDQNHVPQESHDKCQENNINEEYDYVIQQFLAIARIKNFFHL